MKNNIDDLIKDDEAANGAFDETAALTQSLKALMRQGHNWSRLPPESAEALERAATQLARILTGNPNHAAHWNKAAAAFRVRGIALNGGEPIEAGVARLARMRAIPAAEMERIERKAVDG